MPRLRLSSLLLVCLCFTAFYCLRIPPAPKGWQLVWSDEFNGAGLPDAARWGYDVGGNGWGNRELQYYTDADPDNARVEGGNLVVEARRETFGDNAYTSARLVSRGKGEWTYGRVEARAKLPAGRGTWPAIWMLPTVDKLEWPEDGEIDIMEHVGFNPGVVHGTIHTKAYNHSIGTQKGGQLTVPDASTAFHVYTIEWTPDRIDWFLDGKPYFSFANDKAGNIETWPFDQPFHLIFNVAVGGNWGGQQGVDESIWPQRMEVDWVRVYARK
ncbi:MAG: GH16 [uncultured Cytophagales bacterium]|uniref:GH16 n=1 Tax=uncultured Cytophagales bacterium TaxID=158755 RepID=A0A6J4HV12_9SPHI|nr:MAG: GH16 [uncultured Cytophagales bacterium]